MGHYKGSLNDNSHKKGRRRDFRTYSKSHFTFCALQFNHYNLSQQMHTIVFKLDVRGSVHHSAIHTEKSNKTQQCNKIYYSIFI
jgi:hypothetical protein